MARTKYITIKIAPDQIDFFGAVLNCAVRYCIGPHDVYAGTGDRLDHAALPRPADRENHFCDEA